MNQISKYSFLFLLIMLFFSCSNDDPGRQSLHALDQNWKLSRLGSNEKYKVDLPSTVHTVLMKEDIINHPFQDDEEQNIEWIENEDWSYSTWFKTSDSWFDYDKIELNCKGLDTYAVIFLNEEEIAETNNMFSSWKIDLKPHLKSGRNDLKIIFKSTIDKGNAEKNKLEYLLPTTDVDSIDKVASFVRKAPYHFGWDWAPRIITTGIWKDLEIIGWKKFKLENIAIEVKELNANEAKIAAHFDFESFDNGKVYVQVKCDQTLIAENFEAYFLEPGANKRTLEFTVENPQLWWPNGMGEQFLYDFDFLFSQEPDFKDLYVENVQTGLRKIKLIQQRDSIGKAFQFNINNNNFFAKGANYIPQDVFLEQLNEDDYRELLTHAKEAHFNMLRVWGGGVYERDIFYDLCDSLGIMVWQDFMFACAMYPGDSEFLSTVRSEINEQTKRLQNHPCLALWCGNNEIDVAWKNWGWQEDFQYSYAEESKIYRDYEAIFKEMLPEVVESNDSDVPYVHTSPLSNWDQRQNFDHSSMHYWGVWHGDQPFENVENRVPRFMAEYGFQSFPSLRTLDTYVSPEHLSLDSDLMKKRQKSYKGNGQIVKHLNAYFQEPKDFSDFIYKSQLAQAKFMKMAIEAHRSANKRCAGTLYWQLNDCWPGPSWSSIDYEGRWKAAHFTVKDRYKPIILITKLEGNTLNFTVDSDERTPRELELTIQLKDFEGNTYYRDTMQKIIAPDKRNLLKTLRLDYLVPPGKRNRMYVQARLKSQGKIIDEELFFFKHSKYLALEPFEYTHAITAGDTIQIELRTNTLVKNAELSFPMKGNFSQNYFDIEADTTYHIQFYPRENEKIKTELKLWSLNSD